MTMTRTMRESIYPPLGGMLSLFFSPLGGGREKKGLPFFGEKYSSVKG